MLVVVVASSIVLSSSNSANEMKAAEAHPYGFSCLHQDVRDLSTTITSYEAISIAEQWYSAVQKEFNLENVGPFEAVLRGSTWHLEAWPEGLSVGGMAEVDIDSHSGCILRKVLHR